MFQILNKTGEEKVKWGWAVYDWANNVYSLVITTAIFPIFYIGITSTTNKENCKTSHIVEFFGWEFINTELSSYILAASFVAVIILSPLLSGMADFAGKKKLFLRLFCYTGSAGCVGLYWFDPNHLELSMIPFFMASIGFWGSVGFYNAYLPEIAPREEHDKLSARGYAMGYWSSLIILLICAVLITGIGKYLDSKLYIGAGVHMELVQTITRCCFVLVGFWWFGFAHITFNALPESEKKDLPTGNILLQGFKELRGVARDLKCTKHLTRYLFAFFIMSMAIQTIMLMASSFGKKVIKLETTELIIIIFIVNLLAIPGAFGVSALSKRIGNIRALVICIIGWAAVCLGAYFFAKDETDTIGFYAVACGIGFLMGGTQSLNRATYSKILPDTDDPASYFSFYEMLEKGGLIIGMFGWGFIEGFTGTMHNSVLAMLVLFTLAYLAMMLVPKEYRIKVDYK